MKNYAWLVRTLLLVGCLLLTGYIVFQFFATALIGSSNQWLFILFAALPVLALARVNLPGMIYEGNGLLGAAIIVGYVGFSFGIAWAGSWIGLSLKQKLKFN